MPEARILDDSGQGGPWTDTIREVLGAAGFELTTVENEHAALTILIDELRPLVNLFVHT